MLKVGPKTRKARWLLGYAIRWKTGHVILPLQRRMREKTVWTAIDTVDCVEVVRSRWCEDVALGTDAYLSLLMKR